jgi:hypothetical protein
VVTATKRAENLQDVPISVQAHSPATAMRAQGAMTFDDYVELPAQRNRERVIGPGQKEIYIRGSAYRAVKSMTVAAPAQGSAPGVALYLDETPVSFGDHGTSTSTQR